MTLTTPRTVERSYQLLALLDVCEHSARYIGNDLAPELVGRAAGSLAHALELASEIAGEVHDFVEVGERTKVVKVVS